MGNNNKIRIALGSDHAGFNVKKYVIDELLKKQGYNFTDFGTNSEDSVDYPDFVHPVAQGIGDGSFDYGIVLCGSGNGVNMTVNKYPSVRSALCWIPEIAELARLHNNANVIALPGKFLSYDEALIIAEIFLNTGFEGGRHERRVNKICSHS